MAPNLTVSEQLAYSTVRVEAEDASGDLATGTGFFFKCVDDGQQHVPVIVTNKHVIAGSQKGRFHLTVRGSDGGPVPMKHIQLELEGFEKRWIHHPDPAVDLAAMPILPLLAEAKEQGKEFFYINLDNNLVPTPSDLADLGALEDIVMVGYPNGIWDRVNNMPLFRRGITATHPNLDYEGRKEFMIDAACFPGSSGSPVFLYNVGGWATRDGGMVMGGTRIKLLGVLYAGPQHTAAGEVHIVTVPTHQEVVALSSIPNNLGLVIKGWRLREFDDVLKPLVKR